MRYTLALIAVLVLTLTACSGDDAPSPETVARPADVVELDWDAFVDAFIEEFFRAHPTFAVVNGRHEYDGQLPDWSQAGIAREIARLHSQRDRAAGYEDADLDAPQRAQRDYLIAVVDRHLFWLETADWPARNPAFYFDWLMDSLDPSPYVTLDYAPAAERMAALTRWLRAVPRAARQIGANLRHPMPRTYLDFGVASFGGLAHYFQEDLRAAFEGVGDAAAREAFTKAADRASAAMRELAEYLEAGRAQANDDYALGASLFRQMVRQTELVDLGLAELEAIGRADLARNQQLLGQACSRYAPGQSIRACFDKMAANKPEDGAVAGARAQLGDLKQFLIDHDLVTIPGEEVARVEEAPPYARSNFAYINIPGPYETDQPSIYYIAPPDPSWPEAMQRDYVPGRADLLFTSVHEVWPGHFLNFLHAKRSDWIFGRIFVGYAFAEGWAHYTEEMMREAGLGGGDPEIVIGQLSNALLRNARYLSAIGLHAQGMTVEESEALFRDEAYQDAGTARQQAARGTYDPAYLNYTMGKLMILRLREDWTSARDGRASWKAFHDTFLSFGGPPIPLVRARMLDEPPSAVFPPR